MLFESVVYIDFSIEITQFDVIVIFVLTLFVILDLNEEPTRENGTFW